MNDTSDNRTQPNYTLKLPEHLYKRIDDVVRILNIKGSCTKKKWLMEAIQEKLEREKEFQIDQIPKIKQISLHIPTQLNEEICKKIELIKNFRDSFSKKQFILEAINEKLNADESSTQKILKKMLK